MGSNAPTSDDSPPVLVLYGSKTGTAEQIAARIQQGLERRGYRSALHELNKYGAGYELKEGTVAILVVATTGDGEPTENAAKFWRAIRRRTNPRDLLAGVRYTVLGLGDTNYTNFCNAGVMIDKHMHELGAHRFYPLGKADDAVGLEDTVEPWIAGLWAPLSALTGRVDPRHASAAPIVDPPASGAGLQLVPAEQLDLPAAIERLRIGVATREHPALARIQAAEWLTRPGAVKRTLRVVLDVADAAVGDFEPGDAFAVQCANREAEVDYLLSRCSDAGDASRTTVRIERGPNSKKGVPAHLAQQGPCTVRDLLHHAVDIRSPVKRSLLGVLASSASADDEAARLRHLTSREGGADFDALVRSPGVCILDLLAAFPSVRAPVAALLEQLPQLQPRYYSAASSRRRHAGQLHVAFNVEEFAYPDLGALRGVAAPADASGPADAPMSAAVAEASRGCRVRRGLCTGWLEDAAVAGAGGGAVVRIWPRPRQTFRLPRDPSLPLVLIGPGTGVAPFVGFLQERSIQRSEGQELGCAWLFFGNRHRDRDYLFEAELSRALADGDLTRLVVTFSRDDPAAPVRYVSHAIRAHGDELAAVLLASKGACVYVCGDARGMASDVHDALRDVLRAAGADADSVLSTMLQEGRYLRDVWA